MAAALIAPRDRQSGKVIEMAHPSGKPQERLRLQRLELYDRVYGQLSLQEQVEVDSVIADWTEHFQRFGTAMGKELLVAIALWLVRPGKTRETRPGKRR